MQTGLIVALVLIGLVVLWYIWTMNRFAQLVVKIEESDSGIDVALTQRYDTLTKMLDVTKAYAAHEVATLSKVVELRQGMSMAERSEANRQMDAVEGRINILAEAYPELRSSDNFRELQTTITEVEDNLQAARRIYNMNVSVYNQMLVTWPDSIVGRRHNHQARDFFEADEKKKQDVEMKF